jgi:hypothetical protein
MRQILQKMKFFSLGKYFSVMEKSIFLARKFQILFYLVLYFSITEKYLMQLFYISGVHTTSQASGDEGSIYQPHH